MTPADIIFLKLSQGLIADLRAIPEHTAIKVNGRTYHAKDMINEIVKRSFDGASYLYHLYMEFDLDVMMEISAVDTPEGHACRDLIADMYLAWGPKNLGTKCQDISKQEGKLNRIIKVSGTNANRIIGECGMHRIARVSPFDPLGRRHTTKVKVSVNGMAISDEVRSYYEGPINYVKNHIMGTIKQDAYESALAGDINEFLI